jgi:uncharacterized tellurite resistance protein B-like protein
MDRTEHQRFTFLKALIGAAWLDKTVKAEALNVLKTYLRRLNYSDEERVGLKGYLTRSLRERDAQELVEAYLGMLPRLDRNELYYLHRAITDLSENLTDVTDHEFLENVVRMLHPCVSVETFLRRFNEEVFSRGGLAETDESGRADDLDDFVRTRIMAAVKSKMLDLSLSTSHLSAREIAYITSLSALLGRIAHADEDFSEEEKAEIAVLLKETTSLDHQDIDVIMSTIVDDTLKGMDLKSVTRTYYNLSTPEQREQLLNCLFLVAGADGHVDRAEVDEIERIAVGLNMSHRDILRARSNAMEVVRKRLMLD